MSTKRSGWITGVVVLQFLYVLGMLALPVYLLVLTRTAETRSSPDAAEEISGLRIAAAVLGAPALGAIVAWFGLWKGKLWGWWLTVLTDMGLVGVFVYSLIDDGWKNIEWDVAVLSLIGLIPVVYLLLPKVRRFYWRGKPAELPACGGVIG
jgi:uncharacterized membrane protein (DUF2068 family)